MKNNKTNVALDEISALSSAALVAHGADQWVANEVARAIRRAEATGNLVCGLYYLDSYCTQLRTGRVNGQAVPLVTVPKPAAVHVDAQLGFAQSAFSRGLDSALKAAREHGVATLAIAHSHTCTAMSFFTSQIAQRGLIAIGMTNAPACVSPPGGTKAVLGTNPIAMSVPDANGGVAFEFDQSTSAIAIGKIRMAAANGESIPLGWAVDKNGAATDDPNVALEGSLVSAGGYKGFSFGLMAETLAALLTGSLMSTQAPPLKAPEGPPHNLGQFYVLIDPSVHSDQFQNNLAALGELVNSQEGARLPGSKTDIPSSVSIDAELWEHVSQLAGASRK